MGSIRGKEIDEHGGLFLCSWQSLTRGRVIAGYLAKRHECRLSLNRNYSGFCYEKHERQEKREGRRETL